MARTSNSTTAAAAAERAPVRYRALNGLSYPTDSSIIQRLLNGEQIPMEERGMVERSAGEILTDIPACSVGWLLEQGEIEVYTGMAVDFDPLPEPEPDAASEEG